MPSHAIQITFEMQSQGTSHKRAVKKIRIFQIAKHFFFNFFHCDHLLLSNLITFLFILINDLKCYRSATWSSINHLSILIATKHTRNYFDARKLTYDNIFMICVFEFLTPSTLGGHKFFNSILFLNFFSAPDASIEGVQVLFGHQKQQSPSSLGSSLLWVHKCSVPRSIYPSINLPQYLYHSDISLTKLYYYYNYNYFTWVLVKIRIPWNSCTWGEE